MTLMITIKPTSTGGKRARVRICAIKADRSEAYDVQVPQVIHEHQEVTVAIHSGAYLVVEETDEEGQSLESYMRG